MRYLIALVILILPITAGADQRSRQRRAPAPPPLPAQSRPVIHWTVALREWQRPYMPGDLSRPSGRPRDMSGPSGRRGHQGRNMPRWWSYPGSQQPHFGGSYYALPYSGYYPAEDVRDSAPRREPEPAAMRATGVLRLDITPATGLQYYIDGMYIGSSSDLGTEFEVNAGARRIEIRASGYKPVVFDARFVPGGTVTRRGALEPLEDSSTLPRAIGSRTMYVIPGCYMGNTRPNPSALPRGCDIGRLTTRDGS